MTTGTKNNSGLEKPMNGDIKKAAVYFSCVLAFILPLTLGIYFRLYPLFNQTSTELYDRATLLVISQIQKTADLKAKETINHDNPGQLKHLAKRLFDKFLHAERKNIQKNIDAAYRDLIKHDPSARHAPYLLEADPYNYYALTKNIIETGHLSRQVKGSKYFNERMLAPSGHWEPLTLHPYVGYWTYRFFKIFKPDMPLMSAVAVVPLILTVLAAGIYFRLVLFLGGSALVAGAGLFFLLLSPIFAKRSAFGWYDNDPYNVIFGLLILQVFLVLLKQTDLRKILIWSLLCAFMISMYAFFWQGWMYLLCILSGCGIAVAGYRCIFERNLMSTRNLLLGLLGVPAGTVLLVGLTFGFHDFFVLFKEGWTAFKNFLEPQMNLWPDIYIGVGELHKVSSGNLIEQLGRTLCILAGGGFLHQAFLFFRKKLHSQESASFIVLSLFGVTAVFMALGAQRFTLIGLIPLSLFAAIGLKAVIGRLRDSKPVLRLILILIGIAVLGISPLKTVHEEMFSWRPIYNDVWDKVLKQINEKTPAASIINTWWPPGHFITAMAERRVTFSGATINVPQAYWLSDVLLAADEKQALGILRMLNSSANQAVEFLQTEKLKTSEAVELIKNIAPLNANQAQVKLQGRLSDTTIAHVLKLTHGPVPPSYLFIYNEMAEQHLEFSFIGRWNFRKIEQIQADKALQAAIPKRNSPEYIKYLWDLAGGPLRSSETLIELNRNGDSILFDKGVAVNLKEMACLINSKNFGKGIPQYLIYFDGTGLTETKLENPTLNISVLVRKQDDRYNCQLIDYSLAKSLLFRLFYFKGSGLKYLEPFIHETDLTRRTEIFVFRIDWEEFLKDL